MSSSASSSTSHPISEGPNEFIDGDCGNSFADSITRFDKGPFPPRYWDGSAVGAGELEIVGVQSLTPYHLS